MGTNWGTGSSVWTWGRTSSLWGWRSTGTGCQGRLWSLLLWRYSRPAWTRSCAACCRWPCHGQEGWTRWPTEVPSNPYYSVILWLFAYSISRLSLTPQHLFINSPIEVHPALWSTKYPGSQSQFWHPTGIVFNLVFNSTVLHQLRIFSKCLGKKDMHFPYFSFVNCLYSQLQSSC